MKDVIGSLFAGVGALIYFIAGIWGFFLSLGIISDVAGFWGIVIAIFLAPVTVVAAPIYAGFEHGDWFPMILIYGGGITGAFLSAIGSGLNNE
jgi:hypothetical protein